MHAVLDYGLGLTTYAYMKDGKTYDIKPAKIHSFPPDSVIVMDRAYLDFFFQNMTSTELNYWF